jgi:hypothetical protein
LTNKTPFEIAIQCEGFNNNNSIFKSTAFLCADIIHSKLVKNGAHTQLIVDDKPFLILGGELEIQVHQAMNTCAQYWPAAADES